jgi:pyruvate/2-oxoglutarate dehydrogenase complex dihydrolipoamide acyltransferase (E2) component
MPTPLHTPRVNNNDDVVRLLRVMVKPGDHVSAGDIVAEVETDKASFTVEAEQPGFVLAVIPQVQDMIDVGSVLLWVGATAEEAVPQSGPLQAPAPVVSEPTVKAAQLLAKYGLKASDVPASGARLSAKDVEDYVAARGALAPEAAARTTPAPTSGGPTAAGTSQPLSPEDRGMLRTVVWQRDEAVPGYVELLYDAAAWDRAAVEYQKAERLLMSPLLALMAFRLVAAAKENGRLASTIVGGDQRFVYDSLNVGFTVQTDSSLYLAVVEKADLMTCREFVNRLSELQRSAMAHRLRANESAGATVSFTSMARWNATRHVPVLPPFTSLIVAHAATLPDGRGVLGATYDHRVLTGHEALTAFAVVRRPEGLS